MIEQQHISKLNDILKRAMTVLRLTIKDQKVGRDMLQREWTLEGIMLNETSHHKIDNIVWFHLYEIS